MLENNGKKYVHIAVLEQTKDRLDATTPKAYTYDQMLNGLLDIWDDKKEKVSKTGKPAQNNQIR